jgi:hypothetical protein
LISTLVAQLPNTNKGGQMKEYRASGARLGWLLDPIANRAYVYRQGDPVQEIEKPEIIKGDPVLPGFNFDFREIL